MTSTKTRITVLISGNGTNLQALIDATGTAALPNCEIIRVLSNRKGVKGLERAEKAGIPTIYHNLVPYSRAQPSSDPAVKHSKKAREAYDKDLAAKVLDDRPDLVVCAGFMHILSSTFLDLLAEQHVAIINLHPALPGAFSGAGAITRAHDAFANGKIDKTGLMIHYVIDEVDMGEPILTKEIPLRTGESLEGLEERFHQVEHIAIVEDVTKPLQDLLTLRLDVPASKTGAQKALGMSNASETLTRTWRGIADYV